MTAARRARYPRNRMNRDIFENLFVLEMTNNHQGSLERGLAIIREHSRIARFNNVRTAIFLLACILFSRKFDAK